MEILITHVSTDSEYTEYFPNNFDFWILFVMINESIKTLTMYYVLKYIQEWKYKIVNKELYRILKTYP